MTVVTGAKLSKLALLYSTPVAQSAANRLGSLVAGVPSAFDRGMDDNNRQRRQHDSPYQGDHPRFVSEPSQGREYSAPSERHRPSPLTGSLAAGRGAPGATPYAGYYPEPASSFSGAVPQNNMQYQSIYSQEQRQQSYTSYSPHLLYNVAQPPQPSNVYDSPQQFQARQPTGMQIIPDVAAPYFPNEPASAPDTPALQPHASTSSSSVYPQHHQSPVGYAGNMAMAGVPQSGPEIIEEEDFPTQTLGMEAAYTAYQTALKEIFQMILSTRLSEASQTLLQVSEWLLGHVSELGLTVDEVTLHGDRIRLWGEFNTAWLSIFQKQKDLLESGQRVQPPQSIMSQEVINTMAKDLIRMCDAVEKHGLVDYQYGVAEEQIMTILMETLDLQESIEGVESNATAQSIGPSSRAPS